MKRLDRLYSEAMGDAKDRQRRDWFSRVSAKAVPTYFGIGAYCYNRGIAFHHLNTEEGQTLIKDILERPDFRESYPDSDASFDILMEWWNESEDLNEAMFGGSA